MRPAKTRRRFIPRGIAAFLLIFFVATGFPSLCGAAPLPYNYRLIDGHIHAGGHPMNPRFTNSDAQTLSILEYLKSKGVKTVIDLENTRRIQKRYEKLLKKEGLALIHVPMSASKVPTAAEWAQIKKAMKGPVYIHCQWGADRTGIVIAKYLVDVKGYFNVNALKAVETGGSHAGPMGGFKPAYYGKAFQEFLSRGD